MNSHNLRTRLIGLVAAPVLAGVLVIFIYVLANGLDPVQAAPGAVESDVYLPTILNIPDGPLVTVMIQGPERVAMFQDATRSFEQQSGITIYYQGFDELNVIDRLENGYSPDLVLLPNQWILGELASQGYTVDLFDWFDLSYLQQQYNQSWLDMATFDGELAGVWYQTILKSLVWYPMPEFADAGYVVPQTWNQLIALSDQMVNDGKTPWCIGIASGLASGWPGTDWVEDIMLRTTSLENYDSWIAGDLKFSSQVVSESFTLMGQVWFTEDYVLGGRSAITTTFFADAPLPMFDDPPSCWLHRQAPFISEFFPAGVEVGVDVDYFQFPEIDPTYGDPALVAGDVYGILEDRPEVRQFVEYLTTADSVRYFVEHEGKLSPHQDFNLDWLSEADRGFGEILLNADGIRFDASDVMPGEVGAGSFWSGIIDYVNGKELGAVLADIDATWPP